MLSQVLAPLAAWPQFVAWRIEDGRKLPYSPIHGRLAATTKSEDWGTYEQAAAMSGMSGVGFVFTERDPFWFVDIDGALQADNTWSLVAQELCARLTGAAVEVSQSGRGLHIIGSGTVPAGHRNKNIPLKLELYTKERFVALTDAGSTGSAAADLTHVLPGVVEQFFKREGAGIADEWTTEPHPDWRGPDDDMELLGRILRSGGNTAASAFGATGGPTFEDLWTANVDALAAKWPGTSGPYDASSADQSMANTLAFWTGKNCDRIERMMRLSALARGKWDEHASYLQNTILKAVGLVSSVYQERTAVPPAPPPSQATLDETGFTVRENGGLMLYQTQLLHFAGCTYIVALNKVLTPKGQLLDQARFNALYGGHEFVIDIEGKKLTRSAWDAFTENENYPVPSADRLCFRPETGSGNIIEEGGETLANSYVAIDIPTCEGDPGPFLDLMSRQLPDERDRKILLTYMASVAQNPGLKAQWWPVLQGLKGNGKTVYLTIMEYAVGARYTHLPGVGKMVRNGMNFNGWIDRKLFLGMEEIKGAHRREFFEEFKTTVTNRRLAIEGKGVEEATGDNRANGILTTNHKDGVPLERDERRYAVFFMRQQEAGDLQRDGLGAKYFADFHNWLFGREDWAAQGANYGLRVLAGYLRSYQTEAALDPARLAIWAPVTTSTAEALTSSRGRAEQEILEAIEQGEVGFAGGWVSSMFLDKLLDRLRIAVPRNKRRDLMVDLGYDYHPALTDGRVSTNIMPDNGKPRLFCVKDNINFLNLTTSAEVGRAYGEAQAKVATAATAAAFK